MGKLPKVPQVDFSRDKGLDEDDAGEELEEFPPRGTCSDTLREWKVTLLANEAIQIITGRHP